MTNDDRTTNHDPMTNHETRKATDGAMANEATGNGGGLDRRGFLRAGSLGVGLAALAAACVTEREPEQVTRTGTLVATPSTLVPPFPGTATMDAAMAMTALSVERLAAEVYGTAADEDWFTSAEVTDLAGRLQGRHEQHATLVATQVTQLGQDPAGIEPTVAREDLADSPIEAIKGLTDPRERQLEVLAMLADIEDQLAQLYAKATEVATTESLRGVMSSLAGATARQYTAVSWPAGLLAVPFSFLRDAPASIPETDFLMPPGAEAN